MKWYQNIGEEFTREGAKKKKNTSIDESFESKFMRMREKSRIVRDFDIQLHAYL